ncbi:MAG: hypothetical protein AB1469_04525 [Pseudomonadota bacterium]
MLRIKWLNIVLACLLATAPLQGTLAQAAQAMQPAAHVSDNAHAAMQHDMGAMQHNQQHNSTAPCTQHKGPCPACSLCGAHCAAAVSLYHFVATFTSAVVTLAPPLLKATLALPPPGEPPRALRA